MADTTRTQLAAGTGSAAAVAPSSLLRLVGFSVVETAGSTAAVSFQEGTSSDTTKEICATSLAANEAKTIWLGDYGVPAEGGIWVNRLSGTTRITVHYRVSDKGKDSYSPPYW